MLRRADRIDNYVVSLVDLYRSAPMMFEPKPTGADDPAFPRPADSARGVANLVARGFFTAGDSAMAQDWAKLGQGQGDTAQVAPFLAAIGSEETRKKAKFEQPMVRAALRGLDRGAAGRDDVSGDGYLPPIAEMTALDEAAQMGRVGETVLRALIVLGPEGPAGRQPARGQPRGCGAARGQPARRSRSGRVRSHRGGNSRKVIRSTFPSSLLLPSSSSLSRRAVRGKFGSASISPTRRPRESGDPGVCAWN